MGQGQPRRCLVCERLRRDCRPAVQGLRARVVGPATKGSPPRRPGARQRSRVGGEPSVRVHHSMIGAGSTGRCMAPSLHRSCSRGARESRQAISREPNALSLYVLQESVGLRWVHARRPASSSTNSTRWGADQSRENRPGLCLARLISDSGVRPGEWSQHDGGREYLPLGSPRE